MAINKVNPKALPPLNPLMPSVFTDNSYTFNQAVGLLGGKVNEVVDGINTLNENTDETLQKFETKLDAAVQNSATAVDAANKATELSEKSEEAAKKAQQAAEQAQQAADTANNTATEKFNDLDAKVTQEITDRKNADTGLQQEIDRRVTSEQQARENKDTQIDAELETIKQSITKETEDRIASDNTLQNNIETTKDELQANIIDTETKLQESITENANAIEELTGRADGFDDEIATLKARQQLQDTRLTAIETEQAEQNTRLGTLESQESTQNQQIADLQTRQTALDTELNEKIANEQKAREDKNAQIDEELETIKQSITTETENRIANDNTLQSNIETTKEELQQSINDINDRLDIVEREANSDEARIESLENAQDTFMPKAGGEFTGAVTVLEPAADMNPATKKYVDEKVSDIPAPDLSQYAKLSGANFTGAVTVQEPNEDNNPITKKTFENGINSLQSDFEEQYTELQNQLDYYMPIEGGTFNGAVTVQPPEYDFNPATKQYVDGLLNDWVSYTIANSTNGSGNIIVKASKNLQLISIFGVFTNVTMTGSRRFVFCTLPNELKPSTNISAFMCGIAYYDGGFIIINFNIDTNGEIYTIFDDTKSNVTIEISKVLATFGWY